MKNLKTVGIFVVVIIVVVILSSCSFTTANFSNLAMSSGMDGFYTSQCDY